MSYSIKTLKQFTIALSLLCSTTLLFAQTEPNGTRDVYVDEEGVMRWGDTEEEVHGFGVNYSVPFAHAYRMAERFGVDHKTAIENDVYHFARMGLDLYRIHVWDTEISDSTGNLLENEHLELFDYLLKTLKDRGINYVLTPIAYWGNGWPEPDKNTPGFSHKYGKDDCLTNPDAIKAQANYLHQFLNHVNPYTGVAYKNDPNLIAFEISNEPHHRGKPEEVTEFISKMVTSMRETGCEKPIFYNVSHSVHLAEAYFDANINGGTFQWYPTGLGFQRELGGNLMPNVDDYHIPFDDVIKSNNGAKLVYEFDAADVGRSYIYPAMARSFRTAGIQIATYFSYDPTYMAHVNTEYNTHYMNLVYAPQKALSLMIASKVFREVPLYKDYGSYPDNSKFENVNLSYEQDLAEYQTENTFIYTNNTSTSIPSPESLEFIAGFGDSEIVNYDGLGAYFLDKIEDDVWRLEVLPDAIWVRNLFGRNSPDRTLSVVKWNEWDMQINLPGLGKEYSVKPINDGNDFTTNVVNGAFSIQPGTYLLVKNGVTPKVKPQDQWKNITLNEFAAPKSNVNRTYVVHEPLNEIQADESLQINATVVAEEAPERVQLMVSSGWRPLVIEMERSHGYNYTATIPGERISPGMLEYQISVKGKDGYQTYPSAIEGKPGDWDFYNGSPYQVKVIDGDAPIYIFNAFTDSYQLAQEWVRGSGMVPLAEPGKGEYRINVEQLFTPDPENKNKKKIYDHSMKYYFRDKIAGRKDELASKEKIVFKGKALNDKPCKLQLALVMNDGSAYGGIVEIGIDKGEYGLSLNDLEQVKVVTLPRPYPTFLPYYFEHASPKPFDIKNAESIQFSIGPGIPEDQLKEKHGLAIESIVLE